MERTKSAAKAPPRGAKKAARAKKAAKKLPNTTVIGGVTIKLAYLPNNTPKARAIRKAVKEFYAARRTR
jgi:hypothetical protein